MSNLVVSENFFKEKSLYYFVGYEGVLIADYKPEDDKLIENDECYDFVCCLQINNEIDVRRMIDWNHENCIHGWNMNVSYYHMGDINLVFGFESRDDLIRFKLSC